VSLTIILNDVYDKKQRVRDAVSKLQETAEMERCPVAKPNARSSNEGRRRRMFHQLL